MEQILKLRAKDMKDWVAQRKLYVSGNKPVLAKRIHRSMHYGNSDSADSDSDHGDDKEETTAVSLPTTDTRGRCEELLPIL